jgi:nitroreductase
MAIETQHGETTATGAESVETAILSRRSPRSFSSDDISAADLKEVFEAARWAASSYNEQPWRFIVGKRGDATYQKIFDTLVEFNQSWAKSAPVLVLTVGSTKFAHNGQSNHYALHDTGAATAYLTLRAWDLGLRTHSMGGFDMKKARAAFSIPEDYEIGAVTALGHPGDGSELPEQIRQMEGGPRQRKPLEEIVLAEWGKPAAL